MKRFYLSNLVILLIVSLVAVGNLNAQTTSFGYAGATMQTYTVPLNITSLAIDMAGANSGVNYSSSYGPTAGNGGRVQCVLAVSGGEVLNIFVGGVGTNATSSGVTGGFNGGGNSSSYGAGGGGGTDIRVGGSTLSMRVVVAGGGGGAGYGDGTCSGGLGGGLTGGSGANGDSYYTATGGGQTSGGTCTANTSGSFGVGSNSGDIYGGGGGGGWWGGSASYVYGGGGGGSSYTATGITSAVTHTQGYNTTSPGNGYVNVCPGPIMGSITGSYAVCPGTSAVVSDVTSSVPGSWSTTYPNVTINPSTGVYTGVSAGVAVVTYTATNACASGIITASVTVNPLPAAIGGPLNVCPGTSITLTDASTGGTWSSSNTAFATIGSSTGVVTGVGAGLPTITYILPTTCMITGVIAVNAAPPVHNVTVTNGGQFCAGGTGVSIGLNGSDFGINYNLFYGSTGVGSTMPGSGPAINFGTYSGVGTYTVMATNAGSYCTSAMTGHATLDTLPLPAIYTLTGGGAYCAGSGGSMVGLNNTQTGISYQLYNGLAAEGAAIIGTNAPISFGVQSIPGSYTAVATNTVTGCSVRMFDTSMISVNPVPKTHNLLTPSGVTFCAGGSGVPLGLDTSEMGATYQVWLNGVTPIGSTMAGTGGMLTFPNVTTPGNYTIGAKYLTGCTTIMAGVAAVDTIPLPIPDSVVGSGSYCQGTAGVPVGMNYTVNGVNYQLETSTGTLIGAAVSGVGGPIVFGSEPAGSYKVVATSPSTGCSSTMAGLVSVMMNPAPAVGGETVSGGGWFCPGGGGRSVNVSNSVLGSSYQLYNGSTAVGMAMPGTGHALTFTSETTPGTYSVIATIPSTGCSAGLPGSALVATYTPPAIYNVSGGGSYCAMTGGVPVNLSWSDMNVRYSLINGGVVSTLTGVGGPLPFGNWSAAGDYTINATSNITGCSSTMSGDAAISINPLPTVYSVAGGGGYCIGGAGSDINMPFSTGGVNYQLYLGSTPVDSAVAGSGGFIDFGVQSAVGTYSVMATNATTGCTSNMTGSAAVTINMLPTPFTVSGTGQICQGGAGLPINISNSTLGVDYQLYNGTMPVGSVVHGSGTSFNFAPQNMAGTYTVQAVNTLTSCTNTMASSAVISVNPAPDVHTVTGGGSYCSLGSGVAIGMDSTDASISYTLYYSGSPVGSITGLGGAMTFGTTYTNVGTYTVVAKNTTTTCTSNMSGAALVTTLPLPIAYTVTGGGSFCAGTPAAHVYLNSSTPGIRYYLNNGGTVETMTGTGTTIDFGAQSGGGIYTVNAMDPSTSCMKNMSSEATIVVNPLPDTFDVSVGGSYCEGGSGVDVQLMGSTAGISYQLYNGTPVGSAITSTSGGAIDFGNKTAPGTYTVVATNPANGCMNQMNFSSLITVTPLVVPTASISSSIPSTVCAGTMGTFTGMVTNGGTTTYQWKVNGSDVGTDTGVYSFTPLNGQVVTLMITSTANCASPTTVTSTPITMTVIPNQVPAVSLTSTDDNVCKGTSVFFTASPTFGGTGAVYSWIDNNRVVSSGSNLTFDVMPNNGDSIYVIMKSNYACISGSDSAMSAPVVVSVTAPLTPYVTISVSPNNSIKMHQNATFTANVVGVAGVTPSFQWMVNNVDVPGATAATYSYNDFNDGDAVACNVTAANLCGSNTVSSNSIIMAVENTTGVNTVSFSGNNIKLIPNPNNGSFVLAGNLQSNVDQNVVIEVTNMLGQVVYKDNVLVQNGVVNQSIHLNNTLPSGAYLLNLSTEDHTNNNVFHFVVE